MVMVRKRCRGERGTEGRKRTGRTWSNARGGKSAPCGSLALNDEHSGMATDQRADGKSIRFLPLGARMRLPRAERIRSACVVVRRRTSFTARASFVRAVPRRGKERAQSKRRHPVGASAARTISLSCRCNILVPHARAPPPQSLSTACAPCVHRPLPPPRAWLSATPLCVVSSRCALTKSTPMVLMYESVKLSSYSKQSSAG